MRFRLLAAAAVLVTVAGCRSQPASDTPPEPAPPVQQAQQVERRPVPYEGPLPSMPEPGYEASRPVEVVRAVYEFAGRRPDVLHYVPCFCGCERSGHVGNDDCFVKSRDAAGRPEWDTHGYS